MITGIVGQDKGYPAEQLLAEGVDVHGLVRAVEDAAAEDVQGRAPRVVLHQGDLGDAGGLGHVGPNVEPDEIYDLDGHQLSGVLLAGAGADCPPLTFVTRTTTAAEARISGETFAVAEFAEVALRRAGGRDEWREHLEVDRGFMWPAEASILVGDAGKARRELGWQPPVRRGVLGRMADCDIKLLHRSRQ